MDAELHAAAGPIDTDYLGSFADAVELAGLVYCCIFRQARLRFQSEGEAILAEIRHRRFLQQKHTPLLARLALMLPW